MKVPRPPSRLVPPRTTAVMLVSVYADPCDGSPIPYCPISISAPRKTNRDDATYASTTVLLTLMPIRRADSSFEPTARSSPAPGTATQRELQRDHDHHEDDEGDGHGPQGVVHGGLEGLADVAVLRRPQQEREPAQRDVGRERRRDGGELAEPDERTVDEPDDGRDRQHDRRVPRSTLPRDLPSLTKNEAITTRKPGEGSDGQVDAAGQQGDVLPEGDEPQRRRRRQQVGDVEGRQVPVVLRDDVRRQRHHHARAAAPSACSHRG